jgi:hypothetical protein
MKAQKKVSKQNNLKPFFYFSTPGTGDHLYPSAAGLAGRGIKSAGTGGNALGPHTSRRHQLLDIPTLAFRAFGIGVPGG